MNEEFILRIGTDARAMVSGLQRASSYAKAWGTSLIGDLQSRMGRLLTGGVLITAVQRMLSQFKDKVLEINRLTEMTGANANFAQGLMLRAAMTGESIDSLTMPLKHFNQLIGEAKLGVPEATVALYDLGVITDKNAASTLTYRQAMHNLAVEFDRLHDRQKQAALLAQAFGNKGANLMMPMFAGGAGAVDKSFSGNFFTKISSGSLSDFQNIWNGIKTATYTFSSTVANVLDAPFLAIAKTSQLLGHLSTGASPAQVMRDQKLLAQTEEDIAFQKSLSAEADKEGLTVEEEKTKLLGQQKKLLEDQRELTAQLNDQGKVTVMQMAEAARKALGLPEPRLYGVTSRQRVALSIDNLERRAQIAWEKGNDNLHDQLWNQAQQLRAANTWLMDKDQHPMMKVQKQLEVVTDELRPVQRQAELVLKMHGK